MKHLKYFETEVQYESFKGSADFVLPNVSYVEETNDVWYEPKPPLKSFTFTEWLYFDAGDVYDTKTFYYEDGMTFGQFVNSKYNTDNYFAFIPEYQFLTLSKTEWPTKVYKIYGVAISEWPKYDTPIDKREFSDGLICYEPEDMSMDMGDDPTATTFTVSMYKNSSVIRTFSVKEGTTWEEFIPTLDTSAEGNGDFNNWRLKIFGDYVKFEDMDYAFEPRSLYGPNGQVKKTDVIIKGVHYTVEQQY